MGKPYTLVSSVIALAVAAQAATAQVDICARGLISPFVAIPQVASGNMDAYECAPAPAPIISLDVESRYDQSVETRDEVDEVASAAYEQEMEAVRDFQRLVVKAANTAISNPRRAQSAADCAAGYLYDWAQSDALSDLGTNTANLNRSPFLSSFALSWLQIRELIYDSNIREVIEGWLDRQARDTITFSQSREGKVSGENNHRYWAGLAVSATGIVLSDCSLYSWGVGALNLAATQVDENGYLPHELARGERARNYHMYALGPILMLTLMERSQGRDALALNDGALRRLVQTVTNSVLDPSEIENLAGAVQLSDDEANGLPASHRMGWSELLYELDPDFEFGLSLDSVRPIGLSALGGNLTLLLKNGEYGE